MNYKAIVIGASAGGLNALKSILVALDPGFNLPVLIVQHISPYSDNYITQHLNNLILLRVKEADEKEPITSGTVYFAPPNFHMLIEDDYTIAFSVEAKVSYARPSIDVLFESAAYVYGNALIGVLLTGANNDGSKGLRIIKEFGGLTIVQDPSTAEVDAMPLSAIRLFKPDHVLPLDEIANTLNKINKKQKGYSV